MLKVYGMVGPDVVCNDKIRGKLWQGIKPRGCMLTADVGGAAHMFSGSRNSNRPAGTMGLGNGFRQLRIETCGAVWGQHCECLIEFCGT